MLSRAFLPLALGLGLFRLGVSAVKRDNQESICTKTGVAIGRRYDPRPNRVVQKYWMYQDKKALKKARKSLKYPHPPMYFVGEAAPTLTPEVEGLITEWTVKPALPAGMLLGSQSGTITGIPVAITPPRSYTVTAKNPAGETKVKIDLVVQARDCTAVNGKKGKVKANDACEELAPCKWLSCGSQKTIVGRGPGCWQEVFDWDSGAVPEWTDHHADVLSDGQMNPGFDIGVFSDYFFPPNEYMIRPEGTFSEGGAVCVPGPGLPSLSEISSPGEFESGPGFSQSEISSPGEFE